jgi:hypothetical protein
MNFEGFPKIARLSREIIVTEKLDGTNAQINISETGELRVGSRNRWITPEDDNYGFARWVSEHKTELMQLGPGAHFGEWWGAGIQRRYGLTEKRFSLFNVDRWKDGQRPACCHIVPTLYRGKFDTAEIDLVLNVLGTLGSIAAPGFMQPEGVVIFHSASKQLFKKTLGGDGAKGIVDQIARDIVGRGDTTISG